MAHDLRYAVVCWPLGADRTLGILLGSPLQVVRADVRKVTATFASELRREDAIVPLALRRPVLRELPVEVRPAYRTPKGDFPLPDPLVVPLELVDAELESGGRVGFLPRLERQFFYDDGRQLETLARHFAMEELRGRAPEALVPLLLAGPAQLQTIDARAPKPRRVRTPPPPPTPRLDQIAERLPARGRAGGGLAATAWERAAEVDAVCARLLAPRGSVLVVGPPGIGKSQILTDAVRKATRRQDAPPLWRTQAARLVAGARYLGDWQQLVDQLAQELEMTSGILWVEDFTTLLRLGGSGPENSVAAFLAPLLERGELRLVSEATPRGRDVAYALLPGFVERFQQVELAPLSASQVRAVITRLSSQAERELSVRLEPRAQEMAYRLLDRHVRYERFPGKAVALVADCVHDAQQAGRGAVGPDDVLERFIRRTGMPRDLLDDRVPLVPEDLRAALGQQVVGQPEAVEEVSRVVQTFKAGLSDPDRPLATLLFAGPTGVGKTALAKALAGYFFGAGPEDAPLVRVDMSELQVEGQIRRLIGDGGAEPGQLVQKLRERPFGVVLLDEIEKAHPAFFDILLTVLDEGILVDALGRETSFRGTVVILTTNLGTGGGGSLGFSAAEAGSRRGRAHDTSAVRRFFRPEFFNRLDRVVHFQPLDGPTIDAITRIELRAVQAREGLQARHLALSFTDGLVAWLVERGFDPDYGARALQRVVEQTVVAAIGRYLLRHPDVAHATLTVDVSGDEITVAT